MINIAASMLDGVLGTTSDTYAKFVVGCCDAMLHQTGDSEPNDFIIWTTNR